MDGRWMGCRLTRRGLLGCGGVVCVQRCRESDAKIYAAAKRGDLDETRRLFLASPYHDR